VALIAKLAIAPPVELMVKPVAAVFTVRVSEEDERVKAGAASDGALDEEEVGETLTIFSARVVIGAGEVAALDEPFML
jgi:hypothetical protein